ncbi:MAG TPA: NAD-binding protein, partial [Bacillota bacterium]|nr:NAD-binding protein [Bacillota bacterium]
APRVRNVMIIGGGTISRYLAMRLIEAGMSVKIIELDHERCLELSEFLPEAMIIEGDGTMQDLLIEEGISSTDAVVALTGIDEENLLVSMYAKHIGVPKTITKINRIEYKDVLRASGIESLISPKMISTTEIVRYARDMGHSRADSVITLRRIAGGNVEALEFIATEETRHLGELLINIKLKKNTLVACIHRGNQIIIPTGSDSIHIGDTVVTISRTSDAVTNLNDIFND